TPSLTKACVVRSVGSGAASKLPSPSKSHSARRRAPSGSLLQLASSAKASLTSRAFTSLTKQATGGSLMATLQLSVVVAPASLVSVPSRVSAPSTLPSSVTTSSVALGLTATSKANTSVLPPATRVGFAATGTTVYSSLTSTPPAEK